MADQRKSPLEFSIKEMDRELTARSAQVSDEEKFEFKDREVPPERDAINYT